jgi:CCR4-NOT transcription complex subunit 6
MESSGYSSIYIQRSGDKKDGCGIFYKLKRYSLNCSLSVTFLLSSSFSLTICYLCRADLVQKEIIHYNDLVAQYVPGDHLNSVLSNNSSPEEGNRKIPECGILLQITMGCYCSIYEI